MPAAGSGSRTSGSSSGTCGSGTGGRGSGLAGSGSLGGRCGSGSGFGFRFISLLPLHRTGHESCSLKAAARRLLSWSGWMPPTVSHRSAAVVGLSCALLVFTWLLTVRYNYHTDFGLVVCVAPRIYRIPRSSGFWSGPFVSCGAGLSTPCGWPSLFLLSWACWLGNPATGSRHSITPAFCLHCCCLKRCFMWRARVSRPCCRCVWSYRASELRWARRCSAF